MKRDNKIYSEGEARGRCCFSVVSTVIEHPQERDFFRAEYKLDFHIHLQKWTNQQKRLSFCSLEFWIHHLCFSRSSNTTSQVDYKSMVMNWKSIRGIFLLSVTRHTEEGEDPASTTWFNKINHRKSMKSSAWRRLIDMKSESPSRIIFLILVQI